MYIYKSAAPALPAGALPAGCRCCRSPVPSSCIPVRISRPRSIFLHPLPSPDLPAGSASRRDPSGRPRSIFLHPVGIPDQVFIYRARYFKNHFRICRPGCCRRAAVAAGRGPSSCIPVRIFGPVPSSCIAPRLRIFGSAAGVPVRFLPAVNFRPEKIF